MGTNSEVVICSMPSRGPRKWWNYYGPTAFWGSQTPSAGTKTDVATSTLPSRGPMRGQNCYVSPSFTAVPNANVRDKIRSGDLTPTFSGAHKGAELLRNPCTLGGSPTPSAGTKSEVATSPLPPRGPRRAWNCDTTPAFSEVANAKRGDKIQNRRPHACFLRGPEEDGMATQRLHSRGSPAPSAGTKSELASSPLPFRGPKRGGN